MQKKLLSHSTVLLFLLQGVCNPVYLFFHEEMIWIVGLFLSLHTFLLWNELLLTLSLSRGRYSVELHLSFLRLQGQANDFKIQYSSVVRLFCLPKVPCFWNLRWLLLIGILCTHCVMFYLLVVFFYCDGCLTYVVFLQSNQPHTFVVITLDPPIRKGQTLYPHIVMQVFVVPFSVQFHAFPWLIYGLFTFNFFQFETDYVVESTLSMNEDLLNTKYKDKLESSYKVMHCEISFWIIFAIVICVSLAFHYE